MIEPTGLTHRITSGNARLSVATNGQDADMTTLAEQPLTLSTLRLLGDLERAVFKGASVRWESENGNVISGLLRHFVKSETDHGFIHDDMDVRDAFVRITATFEFFLPVERVITMMHQGLFAVDTR